MVRYHIMTICLMLGLAWHCKSQDDILVKQKKVIRTAIEAIANYDTIQLLKLIDTASYFEIDDRDGLSSTIEFLNKRLNECSYTITDSSIKITAVRTPIKEFSIPFCYGNTKGTFDLLISFTDFPGEEKIHYIDVKQNFDNIKMFQTNPVSDSSIPK